MTQTKDPSAVRDFVRPRVAIALVAGVIPSVAELLHWTSIPVMTLTTPLAMLALVAGAAGAFYSNELLRRFDAVDMFVGALDDDQASALEDYLIERRRIVRANAAFGVGAGSAAGAIAAASTGGQITPAFGLVFLFIAAAAVALGVLSAGDALRLDAKVDTFVADTRRRARMLSRAREMESRENNLLQHPW